MCGIVGSTIHSIRRNHLNLIADRGPDAKGIYEDANISLGHTRLSIIDTSSGLSIQPMVDASCALTFNGEIYNFLEISRSHLAKDESIGDTRTLFDCLKTLGIEKTLPLLNGMFSFCFYDSSIKKLYLARDRVGKKPLFYLADGRGITFSSSLSLLRKIHQEDTFKINKDILGFYFSTFYIPSPHTIYESVKSLQPGSFLEFDIESKKIKITKYWEPSIVSRNRDIEEFDYLISDATKIRLRSDVPLGAFLSGGIDSTIIVGQIHDTIGSCSTYTASIDDSLNEEEYARIVSQKYSTKHSIKKVAKTSLGLKDVRRLNRFFGQPFADSSIVPTEIICELISNDVHVAISGDGSDELFMGYDKYLSTMSFEKSVFRNHTTNFLKSTQDPIDIIRESIPNFDKLSKIDKINQFDIRFFLEGDILQKIDRLSMSKSLEVRSPFLDYRIVELALGLPLTTLISKNEGKYLLKNKVEKTFGKDFAFRKKTGFMLNIDEWRSNLDMMIRPLEHLIDASGIFVEKFNPRVLNSYTLFSIIVFLSWLEEEFE